MAGYDVFIVHARPDKERAIGLRSALEAMSVDAFVDQADLSPGASWDRGIDEALRHSLIQVVLLGAEDRWYQRDEIHVAITEMREYGADDRVVPVLLEKRVALPYGLGLPQAISWDGAEKTATAIARIVAAKRGATIVGGRVEATASRVRVAVVGVWDEMPEELDRLVRRIEQRSGILDGAVRKVDLGRESIPEVDLRVLMIANRHAGKLDAIRELVERATQPDAKRDVIVGGVDIVMRKVPAALREEAKAVQDLELPLMKGTSGALIEAIDAEIAAWHALRHPARQGYSIVREGWEQRYLEDRAPLWRRGDPTVMRAVGGAWVDRARWYVHLQAAKPWINVEGELRLEVSWLIDPQSGPMVVEDDRALVTRQFWWARLTRFDFVNEVLRPAFRHARSAVTVAWLDPILSHPQVPRSVVVGAPGTGKTVLLQHLAWILATDEPTGDPANPTHRVDRQGVRGTAPLAPIPILHAATTVVAHLGRGRPVREALVSLLRSSDTFGEHADPATLRAGIESGRYVFLIDSLDEVPSRADREALVAALGTLSGASPRVVLTTRPSPHTDVELPQGFVRVDIAPLDGGVRERLVRAWLECWTPKEPVEDVLRAIRHVERDFPASADEHAPVENPLLLTCILQVYATYRRLPDDVAKLYSDMVRVLCEAKIRASDDQHRDGLVESYREALRTLSLVSQDLGGTRLPIALARDRLVESKLSSRDRVDNWLGGLANHTGLVRFEGVGDDAVIRPWHRSYQEYLAAEALAVDYANRAVELVTWLRARRGASRPRLRDPVWRGTLRFLVGAAVHRHFAHAAQLIEALLAASHERSEDRAHLLMVAAEGTAEYRDSVFRNESLRDAVPSAIAKFFNDDGTTWPLQARLSTLEALGRLGDPRLPDPCLLASGWAEIGPGRYTIGAETPPRSDHGKRPGKRVRKKRAQRPHDALLRAEVANNGFWIRRWPVTVAEFLRFTEAIPRDDSDLIAEVANSLRATSARSPNRPVTNVSWTTARGFCRWAQQHWALPGPGVIDLPTSVEWEIAARGGTARSFAWGDQPPLAGDGAQAAYNWGGGAPTGPTPVGAFPHGNTPEGLWDIAGNVLEWCATSRNESEEEDLLISSDAALDHSVARRGVEVTCRGGSWRRSANALSATYRERLAAGNAGDDVGFRVVCRRLER